MPVLKPGEGMCVSFTMTLPSGVSRDNVTYNNTAQGDRADFDIRFDLKQAFQSVQFGGVPALQGTPPPEVGLHQTGGSTMRVFQWIGRVAVALVAVAGLALVTLLVVVPRATGSIPLTVLTGSITPTMPVGSVVLVKPVDPMSLRPGDVITFQSEPGVEHYVTHRVVRFQPETTPPSCITKDDANCGEDIDPVPLGTIRGKVWFHVRYVGAPST